MIGTEEILSVQPPIDVWTAAQVQYRPPFSDDLAGRRVTLLSEDGRTLELDFIDAHTVRRALDGSAPVEVHYDATFVREGIYLVDWLDAAWSMPDALDAYPRLLTWALDLGSGRATLATSGIVTHAHPGQGALLRGKTSHEFWSTEAGAQPHPRTSGHVGNRVLWRYSDTDEYEHIYLNSQAFAWQCLRGVERGISELDPSRAYEIADDLYFFSWSEQDLVVESALFIDLRELRTFGRFFALDADDAQTRHHQFGAFGELLGRVTYPGDSDAAPV